MRTLAFLFSITTSSLWAQPAVEWSAHFGGSGDERIGGVVQTSDGNYVLAGTTNSSDHDVSSNNGIWDIWVAKFDATGTVLWDHSYGGSVDDQPLEMIATADGGFAIAGYANSPDGDVGGTNGVRDFWVLKLNSTGALEWAATYGGSGDDRAYGIDQTDDGGFIVTGLSDSDDGDVTGPHGQDDVWVIKLGPSGALQWQRALGGSGQDQGFSVEQTTDGGYVMCGRSRSSDGDVSVNHGDWDVWLVKLDADGELVWEKSLGGSSTDNGLLARQTTDGGYIVTANTWSEDVDVSGGNGGVEVWLVKLDASANIVWQHPMGGWSGDYAGDVQQAADGGFVSVATVRSEDGDVSGTPEDYDVWMVKNNSSGDIEWEFNVGGGASDDAYFVAPTADGGYIIGAETLSDDGAVPGNHGSRDLWIIKVASEPVGVEEAAAVPVRVGPVPTDRFLTITLPFQATNTPVEVADVRGKVLASYRMQGTTKTVDLDALAPGTYFVRVGQPVVAVQQVVVE